MSPTPDSALADPQQVIAELRRELAEMQGRLGEALAERDEGEAQKVALTEVLQVINSSPGDLAPLFDAMLERATRLCDAAFGHLSIYDGELIHAMAIHGALPEHAELLRSMPYRPEPGTALYDLVQGAPYLHQADIRQSETYRSGVGGRRILADLAGARTALWMSLRKEGTLLGVFTIYRQEVRPFSEKEIALLESFAAPAVIALENARLLGELRERTRDLQESLDYQIATSDVLKVISRSTFDLQLVLDTLVEIAVRLCKADMGALSIRDGNLYRAAANYGFLPEYKAFAQTQPRSRGPGSVVTRALLGRRPVHVLDIASDPEHSAPELVTLGNMRTVLGVPLLREGEPIGVIGLSRSRVEAFTEQQIELVSTFADQVVIAIENARLLTETREALEQQTATAEVLQVINSSPGDLAPVFNAMLERAIRLCEAACGTLWTYDGESFRLAAQHDVPAEFDEFLRSVGPLRPTEGSNLRRLMDGEAYVHSEDASANPSPSSLGMRAALTRAGARSGLWVALRKDDALVGAIHIYRKAVRAFTDKQIALLQNFAAQAVIAMENARLITETREALEQQTATAEVLGVINSSPGDLAPVFEAMLDKAMRLCTAAFGYLETYDGESFSPVAWRGLPARYAEYLPGRDRPETSASYAQIVGGAPFVHVADLMEGEGYHASPLRKALVDLGGARTSILVALRRDEILLGSLVIYRQEVRPFSEKEIALLQNFAAQAVIAMENARLITETREALEQQTATAEVLQVINSSPGDLTPVFDAILEKAHILCGAPQGGMFLHEDGLFRAVATRGMPEQFAERLRQGIGSDAPVPSPLMAGERFVHIRDMAELDHPMARMAVEVGAARSLLAVPLRKADVLFGMIVAGRREVRPYSDKEIALLQNFAAQAVIAMENARLLGELRQRTEEVGELNRDLEARVAAQVDELGRVGRLKRFLAPQLAELIVSHGDEKILESHRREIVVVFCDLRGYTAFTETAEPEEVLDFLRQYHGALGPLVSQFEGTLDQFSGDGIMVFFNDPVPCADPAERAVKMAMAMREAARELIAAWSRHGCELGFGIGIAQGYATLGQIGFSERSGYTAIGTVCNLAARLCAEAQDGQILVSSRVAGAVGALARLEDLGNLELKGLRRPIAAFNVAQSSSPTEARPNLTVVTRGPGT